MKMDPFSHTIELTLLVSDFEKAIHFYVNTLQLFRVSQDNGDKNDRNVFLKFDSPGNIFSLRLSRPSHGSFDESIIGKQAGLGRLFLQLPGDVEQIQNRLREQTLPCGEIYEVPYATWLFIIDPFGNQLSIIDRS